ncbi:hypothetical protein WA171_005230 [Blastocystis sp. BT1]
MNGANQSPFESVLSFVTGKPTQDKEKLREREAGSWLLMATDLVPFSPNSLRPSSGLVNDGDRVGQDFLGWDTTNPYEDSMLSSFSLQLPDSSADSTDGLNSLNPIALPPPALRDSSKLDDTTSGNPVQHPTVINPQLAPPSTPLNQQSLLGTPYVSYPYPYYPATMPMNGSRKRSQTVETSSSMDEKRKKRLEKNREIAKNCRKRKKEKREALEEEITRLREENCRMRIQLENDTDDQSLRQKRSESLERLCQFYETHDREAMKSEIQEYVRQWGFFVQKRLTMAEFHLEQLKMLVLPTQVCGGLFGVYAVESE